MTQLRILFHKSSSVLSLQESRHETERQTVKEKGASGLLGKISREAGTDQRITICDSRMSAYLLRLRIEAGEPRMAGKTSIAWLITSRLLCTRCHKEMRIVALIDDHDVIERILRHLGLWEQGVRVSPASAPPKIAEWVIEPVMVYANA